MNSVQEGVLEILKEFPRTRSSDEELVKEYTFRFCKRMIDLELLGFSVTQIKNVLRSRRKVQQFNPDLHASENTEVNREVLQEKMRENKGDYEL